MLGVINPPVIYFSWILVILVITLFSPVSHSNPSFPPKQKKRKETCNRDWWPESYSFISDHVRRVAINFNECPSKKCIMYNPLEVQLQTLGCLATMCWSKRGGLSTRRSYYDGNRNPQSLRSIARCTSYKMGPYRRYKWSDYKPYKWPYKWTTGVITSINGRKVHEFIPSFCLHSSCIPLTTWIGLAYGGGWKREHPALDEIAKIL